MPTGVDPKPATVDDSHAVRHGGRELLSLLLMDARNHLLQLLRIDPSSRQALRGAASAGVFQEHWIGCHLQRQRGEACDPQTVRLAGIEPQAAAWADENGALPDLPSLHAYLADTLEVTLDLLAGSAESDAALHVYRAALWHEDRLCESLADALRLHAPPPRPLRPALAFGPQRWQLGSAADGGYVPHAERWAHAVDVPGFEIDAQPVAWGAFVEFAEDGGYDRPELWTARGRDWLQAEARRAPRHVEQLAGGVLLQRSEARGGGLQRVPGHQPATHLSRFEAEAWCHWAGRRLPTEPEWELAACTFGRGFAWGDVPEWVMGRAQLWPG
ncbi:MAG: SUMF1/EgtB/PvdO family nonheme iron enzyme, partial [Rubrivivax sp.]